MMGLYRHPHSQEATMLSIPQALERIKGNTAEFLPETTLRNLCRDLHLSFRNRLLPPLVTTHLFLRQILEGNTSVPELQRISKFPFSLAAYCDARQRVPLAFFQRLHRAVIGHCRPYADNDRDALWRGRHRVFFLDGSSFSMPDTAALRDEFGQPGGQAEGCDFPTAHLQRCSTRAIGCVSSRSPRCHDSHHQCSQGATFSHRSRPGPAEWPDPRDSALGRDGWLGTEHGESPRRQSW